MKNEFSNSKSETNTMKLSKWEEDKSEFSFKVSSKKTPIKNRLNFSD